MTSSIYQLSLKRTLRVVGLMSGTSADGVDAAVVDIGPRTARLLAFATYPYPPAIHRQVMALCRPESARVDGICHLNFVLGRLFAQAVVRVARKARMDLRAIDLVGSHGQTIYHIPSPRPFGNSSTASTLQIGEPSVIAEMTGITTVADFRPRDIAAGGQGAPLVPLADFLLFRHKRKTRAVQNIGGIANVTILPCSTGILPVRTTAFQAVPSSSSSSSSSSSAAAAASAASVDSPDLDSVMAFDTGPGNMVMDRIAWRITAGRLQCDVDGRIASRGKVNRPLLAQLMRHPFLRRRPPKTTGREDFGWQFADTLYDRAIGMGLPSVDILATVTAFTAVSIADAYAKFSPAPVDEVILCGGGSRNPQLVALLTALLHPAAVARTDDFGIPFAAKEALSFAILAARTVRGLPGNVPSATGARRPVVLGKIIPGRS